MKNIVLKISAMCILTTSLTGCGLASLIDALDEDSAGSGKTVTENHASKVKMKGRMAGISTNGLQAKNKIVQGDFEIVANAAGGYDLDFNGTTFSFTSDGYSTAKKSYTRTSNVAGGLKYTTLTLGSSQPGCCDNADGATLIMLNSGNKDSLMAGGIYGVKTENMPSGSTTTYNADFVFSGMNKNTVAALSELGTGKISLKANFITQKVSGNITELKTTAFSATDTGTKTIGGMSIDNGSITANGFNADLTGDDAMNTYYGQVTNGKLVGDFYGSGAKEAGGVMTLENTTKIGYGSFIAK